ncbi:hypothetical protein VaNZ11_012597 [Volvox africanus]|uniref:Uncharacterized protein n=1 Tax=Volvox africanus TaxID=51714 RepID=A0ABQ5SED3_9CHLO|nr:hypothetical protein VaNZ11_012597 [Volvox africanus]
MADLQGGGGSYSHFGHVHATAQYQQVSQQRSAAPHHQHGIGGGGLPVGIRGRPSRGSGGGSREHVCGHQRRPSRDSDAGSSASEQTTLQQQQQPLQHSPPNIGLPNGSDATAMGLTSPGGGSGTPKGTQRPPPPPGFGAAPQVGTLSRQPAASSNGPVPPQRPPQSLVPAARPGLGAGAPTANVAKPTVVVNPPGPSAGPGVNGIVPNQHISCSSTANTEQQGPVATVAAGGSIIGGPTAGSGNAVVAGPSAPGAVNGPNVGSSTQLNPAAPPFRSLHGGSLEQVEGNLLAQADAVGLKDKVSKFHTLVRQRDALDACILSELSGLVGEAERQAAAREVHRQQAAALEEARERVDALTSQLADRDSQLATARRQVDDKDAALRARDLQIQKLEQDLNEARRRSSNLERDLTTATQRADNAASKLSAVEQELGALREAYKAQTESHAMEQQQAAAAAAAAAHQQQQQQAGDPWHHHKVPHVLGHMGQPLHQLGSAGAPPEGTGAPPGPPFGAMGLTGLAGPPGPGATGAATGGLKGAGPPPPPGPGGFQMPPPLHPLFNPPPGAPGAMDAATAVQMAGFMEAANAAGGAGGLFGDRFIPPPPPGMPLPPGFHLPPHPPPPHPMAPFGALPLPTPEEIQAKILDLLPSDPADAVQWDDRMDAALDSALAPLQWVRDLAHVYGNPRGFMMAHPELFAQRQDGAFYRSPRASSTGGATAGTGGVTGRLMGMPPPPPGMGHPGPPHAHAPFVMPGLAAAGLIFGNTHY